MTKAPPSPRELNLFVSILHHIEQDRQELQYAADQDKHMEHRVDIAHLLADAVQHGADGIGDTARKQQDEAGHRHRVDRQLQHSDHTPAHADVANHTHLLKALEVDRVQCHGDGCQRPFHAEDRPCQRGVQRTNPHKQDRRIGARDQKVDVAVIDDPHHSLGVAGGQSVIDAGYGEHDKQGRAIDRTGHDRPRVAVHRSHNDQQRYRRYGKDRTDDVGHGVTDLFPPRVIGQLCFRFSRFFRDITAHRLNGVHWESSLCSSPTKKSATVPVPVWQPMVVPTSKIGISLTFLNRSRIWSRTDSASSKQSEWEM